MRTMFTNGFVHQTGSGPRFATVGVIDETIVAIGTREHVMDRLGGRAEEVDLGGGLLSPGFCDAHLHPVMGGLERSQCDLSDAASAAECLELVAAHAATLPPEVWVVGGGWRLDLFPGGLPTRQMLDSVVHDRPVILRSADRHSAWVNTRALAAAGVDSGTVDPADGRVEREADGAPSGVLHEGGAISLVERAAPDPDADAMLRGLLVAQDHCFALGITGWQDALLRVFDDGLDAVDVYLRAAREGALRAKVNGALWWDRGRGVEQLADLRARRARAEAAGSSFRAGSVKIMLDGITENFSALLTEPYHDGHGHATANNGIRFIPRADLFRAVAALDDAGFQIHFHALGDLAVRDALDALESIGASPRRHHLAHLQIVQPSDIPRFARIGAIANIQPLWAQNEAQMTELTIPFLDPSLVPLQYPFGALHLAHARLAAGSDWPVSSADPIEGLHVAVNRSAPQTDAADPFLPEQSLPLLTAWDAYTAGSAAVNHRDGETGRIEVGYAADLITLDRNPFGAPSEEIGLARVTSTWVDGERVWADAD